MRTLTSLRRTAEWVLMALLVVPACQSRPAPAEETPAPAAPAATARIVDVTATNAGFVPAFIAAGAGEALVLRMTRTATTSCLSTVAVPAIGVERDLPLGQPVDIAVVAPPSGALEFQCGMGMVRGRVVVSEDAAASASAPPAAAPAASAHADHDPRHGGVLTMEGDYHVEIVVAPDGRVDLWLSDATRTVIPPGEVTGSIRLRAAEANAEASELPLRADGPTGTLTARGPRTTEAREYTWNLVARGRKLHMTLAVPVGGTAKLVDATRAPVPPSTSAPHGAPGHRH